MAFTRETAIPVAGSALVKGAPQTCFSSLEPALRWAAPGSPARHAVQDAWTTIRKRMSLVQALLAPFRSPAPSNDPEPRPASIVCPAGTDAAARPSGRPLGDDLSLVRSHTYTPPAPDSRRSRALLAAEPSANPGAINHEALLLALDQAGLIPPQAPGRPGPADASAVPSITKSVSVPVGIHLAGLATEQPQPKASSADSSPDTMTAKSSTWGFSQGFPPLDALVDSKRGRSKLGTPAWQLGHARESCLEGVKLGIRFLLDVLSFRRRQPAGVRLLVFLLITGFVTVMVNYRNLTPAALRQVSVSHQGQYQHLAL